MGEEFGGQNEDVSVLINVGKFLESFGKTVLRFSFPTTLKDYDNVQDEEERELKRKAIEEVQIDNEVSDMEFYFSEQMLIHLQNMRSENSKKQKVDQNKADQAEDVSSPLEIPQTPILDSTEPSFLKFKIQQFEQLIKNSPLMSLRQAEVKVPQKKTRKAKDTNCLGPETIPTTGTQEVTFQQVDNFEVVLNVGLYRPGRMSKTQEFLVLGSQKLTCLRDKLYCMSDQMQQNESRMPSGFFFIENVFYNDFRSPLAIDYSQNIIDWVSQNNRFAHKAFGVFTKSDMDSTQFNELCIRLNYPYYYVHQGNCEHILIFKEIRLIHPFDNQNLNAYPLAIYESKIRKRKCRVCEIFPAKFATYGDKLAGENPSFFCERCYEPFHYDKDGNLLYEHEVFDYIHE